MMLSNERLAEPSAPDIVKRVPGSNGPRNSLLWTATLVAVALAGLLAMHGFQGAALTWADTGQATRHQSHNPDRHGALGICVFVASMAGVGLAAAWSRRRRLGFVAALHPTFRPSRGPKWFAPAGRCRFIELSVLRL
jgi:hypothetical protein